MASQHNNLKHKKKQYVKQLNNTLEKKGHTASP